MSFPDYDGNGMFKSLGNVAVNPHVGLLFIAMGDKPRRLRVNGEAFVSRDDPAMRDFAGAQMLVRVSARAIFTNCPRYIPSTDGPSQYCPDQATNRRSPRGKASTCSRTMFIRARGRVKQSLTGDVAALLSCC